MWWMIKEFLISFISGILGILYLLVVIGFLLGFVYVGWLLQATAR